MRKVHPNIKGIWRDGWDGADGWGSALMHEFAIAELLWQEGEVVPASWEYRHGCGIDTRPYVTYDPEQPDDENYRDWPDQEYIDDWLCGYIDADDLRHAGTVLSRYAALLDRAGRSY